MPKKPDERPDNSWVHDTDPKKELYPTKNPPPTREGDWSWKTTQPGDTMMEDTPETMNITERSRSEEDKLTTVDTKEEKFKPRS